MKETALQLEQTLDMFANLLAKTPIDWHHKPLPHKWSNIEIMGHLIDSALHNLQRLVRGTYSTDFKIIYDQEHWVQVQQYAEAPAQEVIQLWLLLNKQMIRLMRHYPADKLATVSDVGQIFEEHKTMLEIAQGYLEHLQHHLNKIITH